MGELSERQHEILKFIKSHVAIHGYPPTVREIGTAVGLTSPSTVHAHLAKLEEAGETRRDPTKPRAMLLEKAREERAQREAESAQRRGLPLVGAVAAGVMTLAEQEVEDYIESPFPGDFVLRVKGESMRDAGILDGDLVVVKQQPTARDGEIVVAGIDDEATVKRFFKEADHIRLQPENDAFEPIRSTEVNVLGVVVAVLRKL
jgi:repressor LexA